MIFIMSLTSHIALASYHSGGSTGDGYDDGGGYSNSYVGISLKFKKIL